jgi:putative transposase
MEVAIFKLAKMALLNLALTNAIVRLKERWEQEYEAWRSQPLWDHRYRYVWPDGVYLDAGTEAKKTALGTTVKRNWWRWIRATGRVQRVGLWAALDEVYATTEHQRCWNHHIPNVQAKLPKRLQNEARCPLREMAEAATRKGCEESRDLYVAELLAAERRAAGETVLRDWEDSVTFYDYPREHWIHLRTTNPLESVFSGVRLRTDATGRMQGRDNALYMVFKIVEQLSQDWRSLNGGANLMALIPDVVRLETAFFSDKRCLSS